MNKKTKRIIAISLDVLLIIVIAAVLFIAINSLVSKKKGYTSLFGKVVYAVETDSMTGDKPDSFDKNSLIFCKELKTDTEKKSLKKGDVITFWFMKNGVKSLNTHRIYEVYDSEGPNCQYVTKGDKYSSRDLGEVSWSEVVAIYDSKVGGLGAVVLFAQSSAGFFVVAVLPSILLFVYCLVIFYSSIKKVMGKKKEEEAAVAAVAAAEAQKEELRQQILKELGIKNQEQTPQGDDKTQKP